ncbi:MAG: DegV family protein [Clostridia bacterium]|nr:DegV family protein [Clostridia bacterium]
MKKYVILADSCCDLDEELRQKYDVEYLMMHVSFNEKTIGADIDFNEVSYKDYYNVMRGGTRIITSQITAIEYKNAFEKYLKEDLDVLYIGCSSALSSSVKASYVARDELLKDYPNSKIICIDALNSCMGQGILCMVASEMRAEGKDIDEVASWVLDNRKYVHQEATVEKLTWLKMAGRVSAASAFFGGIFNVKPIIISDAIGANVAVEKVKGRKVSFQKIAERFKERFVNYPHQKVYLMHGDCEEDANELAEMIKGHLPEDAKDTPINVRKLGPIIGASCGPGTLGLYYFGTEETYDSSKN